MNPIIHNQLEFRHGVPEGTILIIFGASGDLTRRKLMPALYHLAREDLLPEKFKVIGLGRRIPLGDEFPLEMQHRVIQYCSHKMESRYWNRLGNKMKSLRADYRKEDTYLLIKKEIEELEDLWGISANRLFYFATNPSHFEFLVNGLGKLDLSKSGHDYWARIIVEKPFGLDFASAISLNKTLMKYYSEDQIFRIDHFLGKEAVQNILIFRMSNLLFQPIWSGKYIDHIQITCAETIGVEGRVDFFEQTGAVRDMIQSHLLQIMALVAMEEPNGLDPEEIRDKKVQLFKSIRKYSEQQEVAKNCVRGQYDRGVVNSNYVSNYCDELDVPKDSSVETYAAIKLFVENDRWRGVPFYLRTGKRMPTRKTEIFIQLKELNTLIPMVVEQQNPIPNSIRLEIQPRAGVGITIGWKPPGILSDVEPTILNIGGKAELREPKAYERLLIDVMRGDSTLFIRFDEILEMWKVVDPFVDFWKETPKEDTDNGIQLYAAGTQGPIHADYLMSEENRTWQPI